MMILLITCSITLGILGIAMTLFSLYVIRLHAKLEVQLKEKDAMIVKHKDMLEESKQALKAQESFVMVLREQINVRDKTINLMAPKG